LKKVINRVASELKDLGLTSEVLKELLENQANSPLASTSALPSSPRSAAKPALSSSPPSAAPAAGAGSHIRWASDEDEKEEGETRIEEVIDEAEGVVESLEDDEEEGEGEGMSEKKKGKRKEKGGVRKRRVRAMYELAGTTAHPEPRIHLVFSSCSSESYSSSGPSSADELQGGYISSSSHPSGSGDDEEEEDGAEEEEEDGDALGASPANFLFSARASSKRSPRLPHAHTSSSKTKRRHPPRRGSSSTSAVEAIADRFLALSSPSASTSASPSTLSPAGSSAPSAPSSSVSAGGNNDPGDDQSDAPASESGEPALPSGLDEIEFEGAGPHAKGLLRRMYGVGAKAAASASASASASESDGQGEGMAAAVEVRLRDPDETEEDREEEEEREEGARRARSHTLKRAESHATLRAGLPSAPSPSTSTPAVPAVGALDVQPLTLGELEKMKVGESEEERARTREREGRLAREEEEAEGADDEGEKGGRKRVNGRRRKHRPRQHRREVFIPLSSDTEFLTLLASALNSLATLQLAQKRQFTESVRLLADEVSAVSSPARPKSDLYIWREIFSLWVEAAIFESDRERDRGERSIEEVEKKLEWFVDQVAKRKLAKKMRHKESRVALEKFIALNVELLDLKKFQIANEEAARKILKKHDKRTALTASRGFPQFLTNPTASTSQSPSSPSSSSDASDPLALISSHLLPPSSPDGEPRRVLTLPGFPSLPHILLSTFTTTLLPIIPALEDYECSICGDVAFKPIRLSCGHKFCVRCLVKMQKRGQDSCPQCRSQVVLRANATNLDSDLQDFLLRWFPKEVKLKEKSNQKEAAREELEEMGLVRPGEERKCVVM
ncbi:hypothetical protein JCM6882_000540, partial [Rhodosporidiobolus microsporus]